MLSVRHPVIDTGQNRCVAGKAVLQSGMSTAIDHTISSLDQLFALYEPPAGRVLRKVIYRLDDHCRAIIAASPFLTLATFSPSNGVDCSPRGDRPGWVDVADDQTLLLPDRRGNNRIDSLRNIVESPRVGLLFMVPGMNETLRVNGRAHLSVDPALLSRFVVDDKEPKSVIVVSVIEAFIQCARALVRSGLWNPANRIDRGQLPSMGSILSSHTCGEVDGAAYDSEAPLVIPKTLY